MSHRFRTRDPNSALDRARRFAVTLLASQLLLSFPVEGAAAPSTDWMDYALLARERVSLGRGTVVLGNVGVIEPGGVLATGSGVFVGILIGVDSTAVAADFVELGRNTSVNDVFANSLLQRPGSVVRGVITPSLTLPLLVLPPLPPEVDDPCTLSAADVEVASFTTTVLDPGCYGSLKVLANGRVELNPGSYRFLRWTVGVNADAVAKGPVQIHIATNLLTGTMFFIGPMSGLPEDMQIFVKGDSDSVLFNQDGVVIAIVFAPNAGVIFHRNSMFAGTFVGNRVRVEPNVGPPVISPPTTPTPMPPVPTPTAPLMVPTPSPTPHIPPPPPTPSPSPTQPPPTATPPVVVGICTFTPGGWGARCEGSNPGCLRDANFAAAFPNGLLIGDPNGLDGAQNGWAALWTTSLAIQHYLPDGGTPGKLTSDLLNPTSTPANVLGQHLVAAKLNVEIAGTPSSLRLVDCAAPELLGLTIAQLIDLGDAAVATGSLPAGVTFAELNQALAAVNTAFRGCGASSGCLAP